MRNREKSRRDDLAKTDIPLERYTICSATRADTRRELDTRGLSLLTERYRRVKTMGQWSLPGGWCDVDLSVCRIQKEVLEKRGFRYTAKS